MSEYVFYPESLPTYKKQLAKQYALTILPIIIFGFIYGCFIREIPFTKSLLIALIGFIALSFGFLLSSKQQQKNIQTYRLQIEPSFITRTQVGVMPIKLATSNVIQATYDDEGKIVIEAKSPSQSIIVIPYINKRAQLLDDLQSLNINVQHKGKSFKDYMIPFSTIIVGAIILLIYFVIKFSN